MEENGVMVYLLFFLWKVPLEIQRFLWEMNEHNPFTDSQSLIFLWNRMIFHCQVKLFHSLHKRGIGPLRTYDRNGNETFSFPGTHSPIQGLVTVPFWGFCRSPSSTCWTKSTSPVVCSCEKVWTFTKPCKFWRTKHIAIDIDMSTNSFGLFFFHQQLNNKHIKKDVGKTNHHSQVKIVRKRKPWGRNTGVENQRIMPSSGWALKRP